MKIYQVDSFTERPFSGNPAAVTITDTELNDDLMQNIAAEMNLSETAFVHNKEDGCQLRWFTPTTEVELCGHATLAAAHILWDEGYLAAEEDARFLTRSGLLTATKSDGVIMMDFPAEVEKEADAPGILLKSLDVEPAYVGRNRFDYLLEVTSEDIVRNIDPNFSLMQKVDTRGVIVAAPSQSEKYDFVSRFFAPAVGVDEDPVTGSAHCCLGPYWSSKLGKEELVGYQASDRGGFVTVKSKGNRVWLGGQAVTVLQGHIHM